MKLVGAESAEHKVVKRLIDEEPNDIRDAMFKAKQEEGAV